jgi:hypothetical protein
VVIRGGFRGQILLNRCRLLEGKPWYHATAMHSVAGIWEDREQACCNCFTLLLRSDLDKAGPRGGRLSLMRRRRRPTRRSYNTTLVRSSRLASLKKEGHPPRRVKPATREDRRLGWFRPRSPNQPAGDVSIRLRHVLTECGRNSEPRRM